MNCKIQTHFLKTCGLLFCKPQRQRNFVTISSQNSVLTACSSPQRTLPVIVHLFRQKSSASTLVAPSMADVRTNEDVFALPKDAVRYNVGEADGWLNIGQYSVFAWSVSGVESCVVIKSEDVILAFDMGAAVQESVRAANVFITHGHIDHIGAVTNHMSKRGLTGMKPARYFVPPHLVQPLHTVVQTHMEMAQSLESLEGITILPFVEGDKVKLNSRYFVKTFPTIHRIPSQGYIVYKEEKKLKQEYKGLEGFQVAALHREGKDVHDVCITPEIAYCGDTVFDVFLNPPSPDLLKVKLLITEATFLDNDVGKNMIQKAKDRGHTHLLELAENAELFKDVGHILLVHFSNKYSPKYINACLRDKLPPELRDKVTPATVAKATVASSYS